jgi:integrase
MAKGSIIKRGNTYAVKVGYRGMDGQWRQVWRTAKTPRQAETLRNKLLAEHDNGTLTQTKGNLGDYLNRWLNEYAGANLSPSTLKGYEYIIKHHIVPTMGGLPLKNVHPEHLQQYYAGRMKAGLSSTSVRHHHTLLHRAFKQACQWGVMSRNPADMVSPPPNQRLEMHTLTDMQVNEVLAKATTDTYHCLFYLDFQTGLRRGELLALRWSDIDLDFAEMSVTRTAVQCLGGKVMFKAPKTKRSRRTVALSPQTCIVMRQYLEKQKATLARLRIKFDNDRLVFSQLNGDPLKGNTVWRAWHIMLKRMGITGIRFHDIRHTMATAMLRAGVHPKIVQERLGHASIATTLDLYSHVSPGLQQAAAAKLDNIFTDEGNSDSTLKSELSVSQLKR